MVIEMARRYISFGGLIIDDWRLKQVRRLKMKRYREAMREALYMEQIRREIDRLHPPKKQEDENDR